MQDRPFNCPGSPGDRQLHRAAERVVTSSAGLLAITDALIDDLDRRWYDFLIPGARRRRLEARQRDVAVMEKWLDEVYDQGGEDEDDARRGELLDKLTADELGRLRSDFAAMRELVINGGSEAALREAEIDRLQQALGECTGALEVARHPIERVGAWQPIEAAPKDCVLLLGYVAHPRLESTRRVYEGRWHEGQATWTSVNGFLVHAQATHWMPLPSPPALDTYTQDELDAAAERGKAIHASLRIECQTARRTNMAIADYKLCDVCGSKAFYDAHLNYEPSQSASDPEAFMEVGARRVGLCLDRLGDWAVICIDCSPRFKTQIAPIHPVATKENPT